MRLIHVLDVEDIARNYCCLTISGGIWRYNIKKQRVENERKLLYYFVR